MIVLVLPEGQNLFKLPSNYELGLYLGGTVHPGGPGKTPGTLSPLEQYISHPLYGGGSGPTGQQHVELGLDSCHILHCWPDGLVW